MELKFAYQNEYRFYIQKDHIGAMKFHIGSIKDFSILLPISQLNSLRFSLISK